MPVGICIYATPRERERWPSAAYCSTKFIYIIIYIRGAFNPRDFLPIRVTNPRNPRFRYIRFLARLPSRTLYNTCLAAQQKEWPPLLLLLLWWGVLERRRRRRQVARGALYLSLSLWLWKHEWKPRATSSLSLSLYSSLYLALFSLCLPALLLLLGPYTPAIRACVCMCEL